MTKQKGICEECKKEYEYEYNPKYPRKYCPECSKKKKEEYEGRTEDKPEVVKPGEAVKHEISDIQRGVYVSYAKDLIVSEKTLGIILNKAFEKHEGELK